MKLGDSKGVGALRFGLAFSLLCVVAFPSSVAYSDLIIRLKNGESVTLPYDRDEVKSMEFSDGKGGVYKKAAKPSEMERNERSGKKRTGSGTIYVSNGPELARAIRAALPGDDIVLKPGKYNVKKIRIKNSGTKEKPIRVRSETRGAALLETKAGAMLTVQGSNWIFENLDMRGTCSPHQRCQHAFHIVGAADNTVIRNNRMRDFNSMIKGNGKPYSHSTKDGKTEDSIRFPDNVVISGNYIYNTYPRDTGEPVNLIDVVGGKNWVIKSNFIADFQKLKGNHISYAAYLKGGSSDGIIEGNLVMCEWKSKGGVRLGLSLGGGGTGAKYCDGGAGNRTDGKCAIEHTNGILRNNIILNCPKDVGIYLNKAKNTRIYNNTLINNNGIDVRFDTSSADIRNNIVFGGIRDRNGGTHTEADNLTSGLFGSGPDDYFRDWPNADLALKKEDGIVDKGARLGAVTEDFCGNPRKDRKPDVGAIEYGAGKCDVRAVLREAEAFGKQ